MASPPAAVTRIDPAEPGFAAAPFGVYAALREAAPVTPVVLANGSTAWLVTTYDAAREVLGDHTRFASDSQHAARASRPGPLERHMLNLDPPDHTRLRAAVAGRFSPRAVAAMAPRVRRISADLVATLPLSPGAASVDLVTAYAFPLPTTVVFDILGVPLALRDELRAHTAAVGSPRAALAHPAAVDEAWAAMEDRFRDLIARKRAERGSDSEIGRGLADRPRGLFDDLAAAGSAEQALRDEELLAMCFLLVFAGFETTMNLIGSMAWHLLHQPDLRARLAGAGDDTLDRAVEEMLRWASPIEGATWRFARRDTEVAGVPVPAGASVLVVIAAANRDPARWSEPHSVDLDRTHRANLAFGHGIHHCVGAQLARLEGRVALRDLTALLARCSPAEDLAGLPWRTGLLVRGPTRVPVLVDASG